jgi:DNA-binding Lrp family transcriptional regulator
MVTIFASGLDSLLEMLEKLDELFGDIIVDKEISILTHMSFFTPCLAQPAGDKRRQMGFKPTSYRVNLDDLDLTIIDLVRRQPVLPIGKLAQSCGIPASTLTYRFEQLIKTGTIIGFGYSYDDHKAGYHPSILAVSTRGLSSNLFDTFVEFGRTHPDCSWVARSLGHWDLLIGVAVPGLQGLELLIQRIYEIGGASVREVVVHGVHEWFKG